MKVAFVSWRDLANPNWGGSEVMVDRIAQGFVERGWDVSLLCAGPVAERPYRVIANGGRFDQYLRAPFAGQQLRGADVVVDVSNGIPFFAPVWLRSPCICLVHHVHGDQWRDALPVPASAAGWFLERRVVPRMYRRFWSVSPSTTAGLRRLGIPRERIREVWNGIDVAGSPQADEDRSPTPLFVVISRLVPHKGVDRVLDAWRRVGPEIGGELVVIGDGPLRSELESRGTPATRFLGQADEATKVELLRRSWALVHGAHHEGWGIVVMEAAAWGVPTIAFDVAGIRDAVVHDDTGLLAPDVVGLGEHLLSVARCDDLRSRLGRKAWERASALSWESCAESAAELVEATAERRW